jgi:hypothetical protein
VPNAKLVAFSVEAGGCWDEDALHFLKRAAGRASERHPGLAALGSQGAAVVFSSWLAQLSCVLQKANVACLRSAGASGRCPTPGTQAEFAMPEGADGAGHREVDDWLAEAVEALIHQAAASAGVDL